MWDGSVCLCSAQSLTQEFNKNSCSSCYFPQLSRLCLWSFMKRTPEAPGFGTFSTHADASSSPLANLRLIAYFHWLCIIALEYYRMSLFYLQARAPNSTLNFSINGIFEFRHTHSKIYGLNVIFNECIRSSGSSLMKLLLTLPHQSFVTHSAIQPHWPCWFLQATYWTLLSWQPPLLKPVVWDEPLMRLEVKVQIWVQWPLLLINMSLWGLI